MKIKKHIIAWFVVFVLSTSIIVKADTKELKLKITHNDEQLEVVNIKESNFNISYSDVTEELRVVNREQKTLLEMVIPYDLNTLIEFEGKGLILLEMNDNLSMYEGAKMAEVDSVRIEISSYTTKIELGGAVLHHDSEGFIANLRWNFRNGGELSDVFVNDVKNPLTVEEITNLSGVFAFDGHDGDISDKIIVKEDTYTENMGKVGAFKIVYEVINLSNKKSTYTLNVFNMYYGKPVIIGKRNLTFEYNEEINVEELIKEYEVSDEFDENIELIIAENTIVNNVIGDYYITIKAISKTLQEATLKVNVKIIDSTVPKFKDNHEGIIKINFENMPSNKQLLIDLEAYDDYDGDITEKITVKINGLRPNVGEYDVIYEVKDNSGNRAQYTRRYQVISDYEPEFFVSKSLLSIENIYELSIEEIAKIISEVNNINMTSYEVVLNTYSSNTNKTGKYQVSMIIKDDSGTDHLITQNINVFSNQEKENKSVMILVVIGVGILVLGVNFVVIKKINS